jgi:hypothetical protein
VALVCVFQMVNVYDYTPHSTLRSNDIVLNYHFCLFMHSTRLLTRKIEESSICVRCGDGYILGSASRRDGGDGGGPNSLCRRSCV